MEPTLSEKTNALIRNISRETEEAQRDYINEKISLKEKQETIESSIDITSMRVNASFRTTVNKVVESLKSERNITPNLVRDLFYEYL